VRGLCTLSSPLSKHLCPRGNGAPGKCLFEKSDLEHLNFRTGRTLLDFFQITIAETDCPKTPNVPLHHRTGYCVCGRIADSIGI